MKTLLTTFVICLLAITAAMGCDSIPGLGGKEPEQQPAMQQVPPAPQPVPQVQSQPVAQPGMQPIPTTPGQLAPTAPGQPQVPPPTPQVATPPAPTGDLLIDKINTKKFELAKDFIATSTAVKQTLKKGKKQEYQVQLPGPPYCQTFIAVADDKVANVDLVIESPAGAVEATDSTQESAAVILNHCPSVPGAYKLRVTMPSNEGEFAVQVFSK